jgi:hypothetical protein
MSKTRLRRSDPERERYWRKVVWGQERSGQSVREYCRGAGVKESAFYWWRRELALRSQAPRVARSRPANRRKPTRSSAGHGRGRGVELKPVRKAAPGKPRAGTPVCGEPYGDDGSPFLPIQVLAGNVPAGVEIHLGDGRMICVRPGFHRQTLREVLATLEGRSC